jgi:hypothetical protein
MSEPTVPRRRRWPRRLFVGAVIVVAVVVAWGAYLTYLWDAELREALAEADRTDPGWRLADIDAQRPTIPDEENSSVQMAKVKQARPAKWFIWFQPPNAPGADVVLADPSGFAQRLEDLSPPVLLDAEQERVLRAEMTRGAAAVAEARKLIDFPRGRHPIGWKKDYVSTLLPASQASRDVVNILRHDVLLRCQDGDLAGAMQSIRASFNASLALRDEPFLVSQLIRNADRRMTLTALERILAQGGPAEEALADFQRVLEEDEPENLFLVAVRGDRGEMDGFLEQVQRGELSHAQLRLTLAGLGDDSIAGHWMGQDLDLVALYGTARHERAQMLKRMNRLVEIAHLPPEERGREFDAWAADAKQGPPMVRRLTPAIQKVNSACRRSHAEMRCAAVLLALERYRRAHGRWPERLEELTPRYLARVPLDPFDGRPVKYARRGDGVTVYSVGLDGEDDGGNVNGKWLQKGNDWGFRLWDVDKRRQPPGE